MNEQERQEHFDLARFVLGYLEQEGSLVAPAAYGVYETLLPDDVAAQLGVDAYLNLRFDAEDNTSGDEESLRLSVNHPLVDHIAAHLLQAEANSEVFINHLHLNKKGLLAQAERSTGIANARITQKKGVMEQKALHHYLRFNFKVTFVSDEKQEALLGVVMDVQNGYAIEDPQHLQRLYSTETTPGYPHMTVAAPRWLGAQTATAPAIYQTLFSRAQTVLEEQVAARMQAMQSRIQRFLELDQARIEEYYDALENDLRRRLQRAESSEAGRRKGAEEKLAALQGERTAKLADIRARYQLRLEVELVNVQRIVQPKVMLPVNIGDRRLTVTRYIVWDPLMHQLEPLVCDVCGQPGDELHLCTGGHLAHSHCMAPQCIDCKREYCQLCAQQVQTCVVCGEPVCRPSLITCPKCKRGTCRAHQGLCHAADGEPAVLTSGQTETTPVAAIPPSPAPAPSRAPVSHTAVSHSQKISRSRRSSKSLPSRGKGSRTIRPSQRSGPPQAAAKKLLIHIIQTEPAILAFAMRSASRPYATRTIELIPNGIQINCECEKETCEANNWVHRPAPPQYLSSQIEGMLEELRREYNVPANRVEYFSVIGQSVRPIAHFTLPPVWLNEARLQAARQLFDAKK